MLISVIIPALNEEECIKRTLESIRMAWEYMVRMKEGHHLEVILSDGGSTDGTVSMAQFLGAHVVTGSPGRGRQLNRGIRASRGDILIFLHGDTVIENDFLMSILEEVERGAAWGSCILRMDSPGAIYRGGELLSRKRAHRGIVFGDQTIFMTRAHMEGTGMFPALPLMEDYEYSLRMKRMGIVPATARTHVTTSVRRFEAQGALNLGIRMYWLRHLYRKGWSPDRLRELYRDTVRTEDSRRKGAAVIVFGKIPLKGFSKTRLTGIEGIEPHVMAEHLFLDTLETAEATGAAVIPCVTPAGAPGKINSFLNGNRVYQKGATLGDRMYNSIHDALSSGYDRVILIGTDIPTMTTEYLKEALESLRRHDSVIGPAKDGGYCLIGFSGGKGVPRKIFSMEFSHDEVFRDTLRRMEGLGLSTEIMKSMKDLDTPSDLEYFRNAEDTQYHRTDRYLREGR